ncbi:2,3-butanediol dehydrogenase [Nosocomiicoccus ampullae]|uniref:(R,R)-butanediol dehydrogenase/meso-butanediol dehydrogenase/diacetyl reductase n=1 Tax=Nosocomiicoccus ampullae TaxID=489910 RepID=A0A9Q2HFX6_9STAP|nr:2,3-butanediol dehydrogenase [Nosocomiicoccus ampullae]MBB5175977.1 (R,R)-butanediol dehydrogenase/meso-butanediol dehydrogenase/diacetyl reductase [Nosocomiicoccus ampullae]QYA46693.1 2,3-butanediol dehydrogenase [Nosocomiicoccus ampullae]
MKAVVYYDTKDVHIEEVEEPKVQEGLVKVKVAWTGICGTDLHEYLGGPIFIPGDAPNPITGQERPVIMGHEFSGVIEEVGGDVDGLNVGDKVCINPALTNNLHPDPLYDFYKEGTFIGLGCDGAFADYVVVPKENIIKLQDSTSLKIGALVEPTAVALQAIRESEMEFAESVAIYGAGPIGLVTVLAARAAGAKDIFVFDLSNERLEKAKEFGATHILNSGENNPIEYIHKFYPDGVDRTFEVAGVPITLEQAIQSTRPRGMVTIVSIFERAIDFNPMLLTTSGVRISSTLGYEPDIFEATVKMIESGQIDPSPMITSEIELDEIIEKGFNQLIEDKKQAKILVKLSGEE